MNGISLDQEYKPNCTKFNEDSRRCIQLPCPIAAKQAQSNFAIISQLCWP